MESASFHDFRIVQELGRGSFGTVYKAKWNQNQHPGSSSSRPTSTRPGPPGGDPDAQPFLVLKRIDFKPWHQEKHRLAAKKEVQMLAKVRHPNIIRYYGSFTYKGALFICMEYASCGDLHQFIQKRQRRQAQLTEDLLWKFGDQLVAAIAHLHGNSIIHRDLKPLNVFLAEGDRIKVGDLGVSKLVEEFDQNHTRVGTPLYLAPEQIKHQGYDFKVDIWALGCLLYLLTALEPPFHGQNLIQLGNDIVRRNPRPLSTGYSPEWRTLVMQLLTKRPQERPDIFTVEATLRGSRGILSSNNGGSGAGGRTRGHHGGASTTSGQQNNGQNVGFLDPDGPKEFPTSVRQVKGPGGVAQMNKRPMSAYVRPSTARLLEREQAQQENLNQHQMHNNMQEKNKNGIPTLVGHSRSTSSSSTTSKDSNKNNKPSNFYNNGEGGFIVNHGVVAGAVESNRIDHIIEVDQYNNNHYNNPRHQAPPVPLELVNQQKNNKSGATSTAARAGSSSSSNRADMNYDGVHFIPAGAVPGGTVGTNSTTGTNQQVGVGPPGGTYSQNPHFVVGSSSSAQHHPQQRNNPTPTAANPAQVQITSGAAPPGEMRSQNQNLRPLSAPQIYTRRSNNKNSNNPIQHMQMMANVQQGGSSSSTARFNAAGGATSSSSVKIMNRPISATTQQVQQQYNDVNDTIDNTTAQIIIDDDDGNVDDDIETAVANHHARVLGGGSKSEGLTQTTSQARSRSNSQSHRIIKIPAKFGGGGSGTAADVLGVDQQWNGLAEGGEPPDRFGEGAQITSTGASGHRNITQKRLSGVSTAASASTTATTNAASMVQMMQQHQEQPYGTRMANAKINHDPTASYSTTAEQTRNDAFFTTTAEQTSGGIGATGARSQKYPAGGSWNNQQNHDPASSHKNRGRDHQHDGSGSFYNSNIAAEEAAPLNSFSQQELIESGKNMDLAARHIKQQYALYNQSNAAIRSAAGDDVQQYGHADDHSRGTTTSRGRPPDPRAVKTTTAPGGGSSCSNADGQQHISSQQPQMVAAQHVPVKRLTQSQHLPTGGSGSSSASRSRSLNRNGIYEQEDVDYMRSSSGGVAGTTGQVHGAGQVQPPEVQAVSASTSGPQIVPANKVFSRSTTSSAAPAAHQLHQQVNMSRPSSAAVAVEVKAPRTMTRPYANRPRTAGCSRSAAAAGSTNGGGFLADLAHHQVGGSSSASGVQKPMHLFGAQPVFNDGAVVNKAGTANKAKVRISVHDLA